VGKNPRPSIEELKFIFGRFAAGADPAQVEVALEDAPFGYNRDRRTIRNLRTYYEAAKSVIDAPEINLDPVVVEARQAHLSLLPHMAERLVAALWEDAERGAIHFRVAEGGAASVWVNAESTHEAEIACLSGHLADEHGSWLAFEQFKGAVLEEASGAIADPQGYGVEWSNQEQTQGIAYRDIHRPLEDFTNLMRQAMMKAIVKGKCSMCPDA
jgi:hypothetical protein